MKNTIQIAFIAALLFILSSFINSTSSGFTRVYGVSENDPSAIELTLNEDKTFTYKDFSNPSKKIDVKGNWELKNKHIHLVNYNSEYSFHAKWKIVKDGMVAKSRKGMTFYSLERK